MNKTRTNIGDNSRCVSGPERLTTCLRVVPENSIALCFRRVDIQQIINYGLSKDVPGIISDNKMFSVCLTKNTCDPKYG